MVLQRPTPNDRKKSGDGPVAPAIMETEKDVRVKDAIVHCRRYLAYMLAPAKGCTVDVHMAWLRSIGRLGRCH